MITQTVQIKAPIKTVYQVITDFESYPKFLTEMKSAKIIWCDDSQVEVNFHIHLLFVLFCFVRLR